MTGRVTRPWDALDLPPALVDLSRGHGLIALDASLAAGDWTDAPGNASRGPSVAPGLWLRWCADAGAEDDVILRALQALLRTGQDRALTLARPTPAWAAEFCGGTGGRG